MYPIRHPLTLPDLGLADRPVEVSLWLVDIGSPVTTGDRLLEILTPNATIDLPSPATGILTEQCVGESDLLQIGQILGYIDEQEEIND